MSTPQDKVPALTPAQARYIQHIINSASSWIAMLQAIELDSADWDSEDMFNKLDPLALAATYPQVTVNDVQNAQAFKKALLTAIGGATDKASNPIMDWLNGPAAILRRFLP